MVAPPRLHVGLLGGFRLFDNGVSPARLPTARQQQLIAFLVLHARNAPVQRQRVGGSLWPESNDRQALTNLRRELHHLREGWPSLDARIEAGSRTLAWRDKADVTVDLVAFGAAAERGLEGDPAALHAAARLYLGSLLPECADEWIAADRERLRQRAKHVLTRLVGILEHDRAFADAIERAQQLLQLEPLDEHAWCTLMRCHARRGERATALHLYQQCEAVLRSDVGIEPSAATRLTYREILDLDATAPATAALPHTAAYPLVGRRAEWEALLSAWRAVTASRTRLFLIRGEAGIGKTRLAEELVEWTGVNGVTSVTTRCYAGEGRLAYAPIAEWLKSDALRPALMKLDASWMTDVARLHAGLRAARPEVPAPDWQLESWQRLRFFEALTQAFRSPGPLVLVVDDLQWADGDTIDWLQYFVRSASDARCLIVGTVRVEEEHDNPALERLLRHLQRDDLLTTIVLGPLDRTATAQLACQIADHPLDEAFLARTFRDTEGHPLFIVERGRMALTTGAGTCDSTPLPQVQAVVAARLALLSDAARATAEVAAAVGRDFSFDILAKASDLQEDVLVRALDELWRRHVIRVQAGQRWDFSHERIREIAYSQIGPARRRLIHRRIAQGMELLFVDRLDDVSASIAGHLDRGGQPGRAVPFLERAAAVAARLSANEEAIRCLTQAVALVQMLPPGRDRDAQELALRSSLSVVLNSARGYAAPEVEQNLDRLFALSRAEGDGRVPARWLWVAFTVRFVRGDLKGTREVAEQALACSAVNPACRCEAHHAMGGALLSLGELDASRRHFEASLAVYDEAHPQRSALGSDLGVFAHAWSAHTLWLLGDEKASLAHAEFGIALARRLEHKYSETIALAYAALLHQMRLDAERVRTHAEAVMALCERYGFAYYGDWAGTLLGWARGRDRPAEGIALIESALERLDRSQANARRPYYLSLLADTYSRLGNGNRAASILGSAIATALQRGSTWWLPALYLQQSELESGAERRGTLQRGLALSRMQHSRTLEQRILAASTTRSA